MNKNPLVSIIINSFNAENFIRDSINSALSQTYKNTEIVFWDNKSTDNTEKILMEYSTKNKKIKYFKSKSHDILYLARKKAIQVAKGDYFAFLDADDWWSKDKLSQQIKLFNSSKIGFVCSNYWLVNERKNKKNKIVFKKIPEGRVLNELLKKCFVGMSTLVVSRKAYESLKYGFNEKYEIIGDYDLVLRLAIDWDLASLQSPVSYYRWHGNNLSIKKMNLNNEEMLSWIDEMKNNKNFTKEKNFDYLVSLNHFYSALILILSKKRYFALKLINKIKNFKLIIFILILLILPNFLIKILRS